MTNAEAIQVLMKIKTSNKQLREAREKAIAALAFGADIEVTEIHTFAKPDDVSNIDFPNAGCEDK